MTKVMMVVATKSGGTLRHVAEIARGCKRRGLEVHLVCPKGCDAEPRRELAAQSVAIDELEMKREISPGGDIAAMRRLRALIGKSAPDVLHLHSSKAGALGRIAMLGRRRTRPAILYTPHAYAFQTQAGVFNPLCYRWMERALTLPTDCVVAVSESEGRTAAELGAKGRVAVIPNGVMPARRRPATERRDRRRFHIGWMGRLVWQKQPKIAVKASEILHDLGVAHELSLAGDGGDRPELLGAIREAGAGDRVQARGRVYDVAAFYDEIDVFLTTSRCEGLPYCGLDAMSRGIPIVGFDVPGVRDLVVNGVTGILVPFGDAAALASALGRLARDEGLRGAMGAAAQERARREFALDRQIDRLCRLYRSFARIRDAQPRRA